MNSYPNVVFPLALDSDYTLFQTYNGTQGVLAKTFPADGTTIDLAEGHDHWPVNGFVTLSGELLYYDAVGRDAKGRVNKLLRCVRGLEGVPEDHPAGLPLYGNVVAQHHNQLVEAILRLEAVVGALEGDLNEVNTVPVPVKFGFDAQVADVDLAFSKSLGATLGGLLAFGTNWNDACPDVDFVFNTISTTDGMVGEYCVKIYGNYTNYLLTFGDGTSTTNFAGSHLYAGAINPMVSVTATDCTVVMMPLTPTPGYVSPSVTEPANSMYIPIPAAVIFPSFTVPKLTCPGPLFSFPPIGGTCMDVAQICSVFPSVFSTVTRISNPLPSVISIVGCCPPSRISFVGCCPPSFISFTGVTQPSLISFAKPPTISVDWRTPPTLSCVVTVACPTTALAFGNEFHEGTDEGSIPVTYNDIGIPEEIKLIVPHIPDLKLTHNLPSELRVVHNLPTEMRLVHDLYSGIKLDVPKSIPLDADRLPKSILVEPAPNFPTVIRLEMDMPRSLQVTGFPKSIELVGPSTIQLLMPDNPVVKMVYDGAPLQLTISPEIEKLLKNLAVVSPGN